MTKSIKTFLVCFCATIFTVNAVINTHAASLLDPIRVWGPATKSETGGEDVKFLSLNNQSGQSHNGELQIIVSDVYTRILDATTGVPFPYEDIEDGETIYAYIGPAMSLSLTPMANASLVLCNIPAGYKVPDYLTVESLSWNTAKTQAALTATNGAKYLVPVGCETTPYLSRNIVTLDDLTPGCSCLLWSDDQNVASRIINFSNMGTPIENLPMEAGWQNIDDNWYYYKEDGTMALEWLLDNGKYYYFNPETGILHTGFLTLGNNTYYLQEDGSLLTSPRTFVPDTTGVLH